jgi:hypothetical protein
MKSWVYTINHVLVHGHGFLLPSNFLGVLDVSYFLQDSCRDVEGRLKMELWDFSTKYFYKSPLALPHLISVHQYCEANIADFQSYGGISYSPRSHISASSPSIGALHSIHLTALLFIPTIDSDKISPARTIPYRL